MWKILLQLTSACPFAAGTTACVNLHPALTSRWCLPDLLLPDLFRPFTAALAYFVPLDDQQVAALLAVTALKV